MLPQDAVAGMPVQNKAIPDDNGIQQPSFVENVLLKLLFFFKIQGRDLALKFWVDFKRIQIHHRNGLASHTAQRSYRAVHNNRNHSESGSRCRHP